MSKLTAVILTAAICLPLGAILQGQASADRRKNTLAGDVAGRHQRLLGLGGIDVDGVVGHRQLSRAQIALHEAMDAIEASQRDDEPVWSDSSGRAAALVTLKEALEGAVLTMDRTATWVTNGMIANDARAR